MVNRFNILPYQTVNFYLEVHFELQVDLRHLQ